MIKYDNDNKFAYFNNIKFIRDDKTGYYLSTTKVNNKRIRLHRAVYILHKGEIPTGYQIHHKDHDKCNNEISNLELIKNGKHQTLHGEKKSNDKDWLEWARNNMNKNARPKANEWHGSKEGIEWHKKQYEMYCKAKLHQKINRKCENCGKDFLGTININKFCSNKCKSSWRRKSGIDNETRICKYCGKNFVINKYMKTSHCSKKCRNKTMWINRKLKIKTP